MLSKLQGTVIKNLFVKVTTQMMRWAFSVARGQDSTFGFCLQDKKNRLYIISAAPSTKVDLAGKVYRLLAWLVTWDSGNARTQTLALDALTAVISARLGTGKGGVRFAPEELMQEVLKVAGFTSASDNHLMTTLSAR